MKTCLCSCSLIFQQASPLPDSRRGTSSKREQAPTLKCFQAFACITFADVPLAKADHMVKPSANVGRDSTRARIWRHGDEVPSLLRVYHRNSSSLTLRSVASVHTVPGRGACDLRQVFICDLICTTREGFILSGLWAQRLRMVLRETVDFMQTVGVTSEGCQGLVCW